MLLTNKIETYVYIFFAKSYEIVNYAIDVFDSLNDLCANLDFLCL